MGTWSTKINGNDTFLDIYQNFFELYNRGDNPVDVSSKIKEDYSDYFNDSDDRNNSLFALAQAQWETKSLDSQILETVREIIENKVDLHLWKQEGVNEKDLKKREEELNKFLDKISQPKAKAKRRARKKWEYKSISLIDLKSPSGKRAFNVVESYVNDEYQSTSGSMNWENGGGGIFQFMDHGKYVSAFWVNDTELEITHDESIFFQQKRESFFLHGDEGTVTYKVK